MRKETKISILKYGISSLLSLIAVWIYVTNRDMKSLADTYRLLSDGFFIPGVMLLCMGILCVLSNMGSFDGISWGLKFALKTLIPFGRLKKQEKYGDYVAKRRENPIKGYQFMLHVGAVNVLIALVFMILFNRVY
ncbi:MAG: DUF3899 domain-containing protein [Erysipelotrichia bacterium]|nr:DUF3899 domain-containing protein [Erysipelotrichia bacterium]